ncbi:hypothetical protein DWW53_08810 [Phocaeicola vulgatus]|nr:hypothetical protein DXC02_13820 [Phocaeicola vulgatus]RGU70287.1 hypothetical protein DWW53_08810 [Phocaeicola vulgatus]RGY81848.1 hypothetical protein DXA23_08480 [Phocaeicola vulgatus]RHB54411.1 hypothetical protein DW879_15480 [Phocaeicola vulgatus]
MCHIFIFISDNKNTAYFPMNKAQGNNIGFIFFEAEKQKNIKNRDSYKMKYRFFVRLIQNNYFCNPFPKE